MPLFGFLQSLSWTYHTEHSAGRDEDVDYDEHGQSQVATAGHHLSRTVSFRGRGVDIRHGHVAQIEEQGQGQKAGQEGSKEGQVPAIHTAVGE